MDTYYFYVFSSQPEPFLHILAFALTGFQIRHAIHNSGYTVYRSEKITALGG